MAALIKSIVEKWVALYVRLSRDDENEGDSNSIAHQIEILTRYAKEHGITNYKIYKDDGYSGTNFKRPGFQEMLADIEAGLVSMVIVKDMSRFGRNYLEVGLYTEIRFPEMGVRFVAVNDGVDSDNQSDNDFTPFRNIMNEWYAKDTSKKLRAVLRNKGLSGKRIAVRAPYGYIRCADGSLIKAVDVGLIVCLTAVYYLVGDYLELPGLAQAEFEQAVTCDPSVGTLNQAYKQNAWAAFRGLPRLILYFVFPYTMSARSPGPTGE